MQFHSNISDEEKSKIYHSYCLSFPEDERRDRDNFYQLFNNSNAETLLISENKTYIGYLIIWHFNDFVFVEIFEVFKEFRGKNLGSKILSVLAEKYPFLILESEPADLSAIAERRINFYIRNGFSILKKDYIQPSYGEGKKPINLWLMGTFSPSHLNKNIQEIYRIVYLLE